jgi:uncharacterized protein
MFINFFYLLKMKKVPVTLTEWMTLMEALTQGAINNLDEFYFLARAILVKSEAFYDHYDIAFQEYFTGTETAADINKQVEEWLRGNLNRPDIMEELAKATGKSLEELMKELEQRLKEQDSQHDGGSKWIGRGGVSPFGHSGRAGQGIRIGGESKNMRAVKVAQERRFRNYRHDLTLDVRQMKLALKGLRQLTLSGPQDELDLDKTIRSTARNAGEIDLIWRRQRKNTVKVLLLTDVGGSMDPYIQRCSQLFSAAHSSSHFRDFQHYYFHNCIYDNLFRDAQQQELISTEHVLRSLEPDCKVLLVGDARMDPFELTDRYGAIYYYERNDVPGIVWLKRFAEHFEHIVWLNPTEERFWVGASTQMIRRLFPMFPLTIDGLAEAVKSLVVRRPAPTVTV